MTRIVRFEVFALHRLANAQRQAATEMRRHAGRIAEAAGSARGACDAARRSCDENFRRARETLRRSIEASETCLRVLDEGDIGAMVALRDALVRRRAAEQPVRPSLSRDGG